jgi:hypothetical protein
MTEAFFSEVSLALWEQALLVPFSIATAHVKALL